MRLLQFAVLALSATACSGDLPPQNPHTQTQNSADAAAEVTIYTGGPIYTGLDSAPMVEAIAVSNGRILATGESMNVIQSAGENAAIIDLHGAAMYPGFVDAHVHLLGIGMRELTLNLEGTKSVAELAARVADALEDTAPGDVLYGRGWIETGWPEGRFPTRDDLDTISPDNPVILERADGHAAVANSAALAAAGIDDETPDPDGGRIERGEQGRATGMLIDTAQYPVMALVAKPDEAKKRAAYKAASNVYTAYGWTGVQNVSVDPADLEMMEALSDNKVLQLRVSNAVERTGLPALEANGPRANTNGRITTNAIKLYMDGALGSRGALLNKPYSDRPSESGLLLMTREDADALFDRALKAGVQVYTHAIGDRANRLLLDWYQEIFARHENNADLRWRIEHAQILRVEDIQRFEALGVIPSMQPSHAIGDLYFAPDRLGPDRLAGAYAWRSLIDAGAIIAGGSDAPVERGDPRIEFYAAVARRGLDGYQDENWRAQEAVTRTEALKMFTLWPAYAAFQENDLGTIEPGKRADFTVFDKDIMTIPDEEILSIETVMTIVDGEIVYSGD